MWCVRGAVARGRGRGVFLPNGGKDITEEDTDMFRVQIPLVVCCVDNVNVSRTSTLQAKLKIHCLHTSLLCWVLGSGLKLRLLVAVNLP